MMYRAVNTVKCQMDLPIVNFDPYCEVSFQPGINKHGDLLPNQIRCVMCGPSNSGKTNVMLNLLFATNGLRFENVYVFSKSLHQPKYKFLEHILSSMDSIGYFPFNENDQVLHPNDVPLNSIMIFDDVASEKQDNVRSYFTMGRHNNIDTFYLSQTYSRVPKQLIRDNINLLILFKQDDRNLRHVYDDHVNTDMPYPQFKSLCDNVWKKGSNSFVVVDKDRNINDGRYRSNFDEFITGL